MGPTVEQDQVIHGFSESIADATQAGGLSPYGTMGQTGNAHEWEEGFFQEGFHAIRIAREAPIASQKADVNRVFPEGPATIRVVRLLPEILGDFNDDGILTATDIDLLSEQVRTASEDLSFDLNSDGVLDSLDRIEWVDQLANTTFGDADLNGQVAFSDFLALATGFNEASGWAGGDFDGNGMTDFQDFLVLASNFGASTATGDVAAIPEPSSLVLCISVVGLMLLRERRSQVPFRTDD